MSWAMFEQAKTTARPIFEVSLHGHQSNGDKVTLVQLLEQLVSHICQCRA
jgi:hypothetical protein